MEGLGDLPGGAFASSARGVSRDGTVVVGRASAASVEEVFRWTATDGMKSLGNPGECYYCRVSVSDDGSVVVGDTRESDGSVESFVWDSVHGLRGFREMLVDEYKLDLTGWSSLAAFSLSGDGKVIVGGGWHDGHGEAFVADLRVVPEPVSTTLATWLLVCGLSARRRIARAAIAVTTTALLATASFGQCTPDPSLWTVLSVPPGRTAGTPVVCYDPATGLLTIDSRGMDGVAQTIGNADEIQGDDIGPIAFILWDGTLGQMLLPQFLNGVAWVMGNTVSTTRVIGTPVTGWYLPVGITGVLQYPTGLTPDHFYPYVELTINFAPNQPGGIMLGSVQFVPEPSALAIGVMALALFRSARAFSRAGVR